MKDILDCDLWDELHHLQVNGLPMIQTEAVAVNTKMIV